MHILLLMAILECVVSQVGRRISPAYTKDELYRIAKRGNGYLFAARSDMYYWEPKNFTRVSRLPSWPNVLGGNEEFGYYMSFNDQNYYYLGDSGAYTSASEVELNVDSTSFPYTDFVITHEYAVASDKVENVFYISGTSERSDFGSAVRNLFVLNDTVYGFDSGSSVSVHFRPSTLKWAPSSIAFPDQKLIFSGYFEFRLTIAYTDDSGTLYVQQYHPDVKTWNTIYSEEKVAPSPVFTCLGNTICFFYNGTGRVYSLHQGSWNDAQVSPADIAVLDMFPDGDSNIVVSGSWGLIATGTLSQNKMSWYVEYNGVPGEVKGLVEYNQSVVALAFPNLYQIDGNSQIEFYAQSFEFETPPFKPLDCGTVPTTERIGYPGMICYIGVNNTHILITNNLKDYVAFPVPLYLNEEGALYRAVVLKNVFAVLQYYPNSKTSVYLAGKSPLPTTFEAAKGHYTMEFNSSDVATREIDSNGIVIALYLYSGDTQIFISENGLDFNEPAIYNGSYDVGQVLAIKTYTNRPFVFGTLKLFKESTTYAISPNGKTLTNITGYYDRLTSGVFYSPLADLYIATYDRQSSTFTLSRDLITFSPEYTMIKEEEQIVDCKATITANVTVICITVGGEVYSLSVPDV